MTSGSFSIVLLDQITVNRSERQRRDLRGIDELAESIKNVGLINPPVIDREYNLIAGERRLEALRSLGYTDIPVQWADELSFEQAYLVELEENVKRLDLTWQERNDAVARYHELRAQGDPSWTAKATAKHLGEDEASITRHLAVARARKEKVAGVEEAEVFSTALNITKRKQERAAADSGRDAADFLEKIIVSNSEGEAVDLPPAAPTRRAEILNADFTQWSRGVEDRSNFNLIHCDFPYGINTGDKSGQSGAKNRGHYDDSYETYTELLHTFATTIDHWVHPSAHLIFWYSMKFHFETLEALSAMGWRVDPFPLVWHKSNNAGILPDHQRGGRRTYETALFASRGDRKIVRPVALSVSAPTTSEHHTSEKPVSVLEHFFRMVCDEHTRLIDPTCGSGNAVKVAEKMGAERALGLEIDSEFAETAKRNLGL